ncbi:unnamed protein product [Pleuronectes platessa]|uniref:Uncharacterized protein n=1 Tax=Pleuronectes platessa TaxID=8262 RepID=A0A9N7TVH8_PLEPL|nr:unnamed protein product [Pleuronectes platessa]
MTTGFANTHFISNGRRGPPVRTEGSPNGRRADKRPESLSPPALPSPLQPVPAFCTGDGHRPAAQEKESPRTSDAVRRRTPSLRRRGEEDDCSPSRGTCPAV